jgi:hypothetical protein
MIYWQLNAVIKGGKREKRKGIYILIWREKASNEKLITEIYGDSKSAFSLSLSIFVFLAVV